MKYLNQTTKFTSKAVVILIAVSVLISVFLLFTEVKASEVSCPLIPQSGRTIINFNDWLVANGTQAQATGDPASTWLPEGPYDIIFVSYDCHSCHPGQVQPNESWYLILKNSQGGVIANTPAISDLPDNLDYLTEQVATNFSISQNVSSITAFHAAYPLNSSESANSITAVCAAFDKKSVNPPDLIVHKTVNKTSAEPEEEVIYTLNYENIGETAATGVVIQDKFDYINQEYLTFVSATPSPSSGNNTWNIGTLNPGQSGQIFITAKVKDSVPLGTIEIKNRFSIDSNETSFMYSNCINFTVTVSGEPDLVITKLGRNITENTSWAETTNAKPTQRIAFSIEVTNTGNATANNVYVNDLLPYGLSYISGSNKIDGSSAPDGITLVGFNIGNLSPGQSKTITFEANVANEYYFSIGQTTLTNTGGVWASGVGKITDTAQVIATKEEPTFPSLAITKSVDKTSAQPGDEIVYTLNYQNNGQGIATEVAIKDPLTNLNQHYLTFISASPAPNSGNDTWNIGTLNYGQSGQITIRAKISSSISSGSLEIRNRANIDSNETYVQYSNYVSTFISTRVFLTITKLVRNITKGSSFSQLVSAEPGDEVEFSLEVRSTGTGTANNLRVWDNLPSRLDYVSSSTKVNGSYQGDGIIGSGIYIGDLAGGQSKVVQFKAQVASENMFNVGISSLTNYGYTSANNLASLYDTAVVNVDKSSGCSPSLHVDKLARNITQGYSYWTNTVLAYPGDEIEFLIKINSVGNETAQNSKVRDELPSRLEYIPGSTRVDGSYKSDGIVSSGGIYIGSLGVGSYKEIKFNVRVISTYNFSSSLTTLTNYAYAWSDEACEINDYAEVNVNKETSQLSYSLSINKLGRNLSQGQTTWFDSLSANPGHEIEFSIQISNIGNTDLSNVKAWDTLPTYLSIISGSTTINGITWGGDVTGGGLNLGTLARNQTKTIKFRAKIASEDNFGAGSTTLFNTTYAQADNVSQVSDQASVIVTKPGEVKGAVYVSTGANLMALFVFEIISLLIAFLIYCRLRENKVLEVLNDKRTNETLKFLIKFYFKLKFLFPASVKKKTYWETDW